jgi:hypothetical protein
MHGSRLRTVSAVVIGMWAAGASARKAPLPPPNRLTLVQAQCMGSPPGPCSTLRFTSGTAILRSARQPAPTCPRTGNDPSENNTGSVRLSGVTSGGAPYSGSLTAEVVLRTTFATDPNGTCTLANVQIETASLVGTLTCRSGRCRGPLVAVACLPKPCADTPITSELLGLTVKDGDGNALATVGTRVAPAAADAP